MYTYRVKRLKGINWNKIRTHGPKDFVGKTNEEAARNGFSPQLSDSWFVTLHHMGQDARGPLIEINAKYHVFGSPYHRTLHNQYGTNKPHPQHPVDRRKFQQDTRDYWKWRVDEYRKTISTH